jgi:xanthine/CO dehydrogenase XdhC/CoxF family maturation factor
MRDRQQIVDAFETLCKAGEASALATVVCVEGSSYRRPGARMLIAGDGRTWGTISGGCLERDVARRARLFIPEPTKPQIASYETDREDGGEEEARPIADPGPSLGCGGRIEILIQRITHADPGPLAALCAVVRQRQRAVLATIIRVGSDHDDSVVPGTIVSRINGESPQGRIDDPALNQFIQNRLHEPSPKDLLFQLHRQSLSGGGWADVLLEWLAPSQSIAIFGDGHDVAPLVELAKTLGWHITIIGSRPLAALRRNFPQADHLICSPENPAHAAAELPGDAAAVVMAHNFQRDTAALSELIKQNRPYIGVLGPRRRTMRLLASARCTGSEDNLYSPIGLNLGAENPEQVALAIVAEIQAVTAGCDGQSLRQRPGPIHSIRNDKDKSFSHR